MASMRIYEYAVHAQTRMTTAGRVLPFYVMSYIQSGRAVLRLENKEYQLQPHSVVLIPPHVQHDHFKEESDPTVFLWWHFDYKLFDTIDMIRLLGLPRMFVLRENAAFEEAFSRYTAVMAEDSSLKTAMLRQACAIEIMAYLLEAAEKSKPLDSPREIPDLFVEILSFIASERREEISLSQLSARFNLHPTYLSNRFRKYYGISPIALFRKLQLERAKGLLSTSSLTVGEVAGMLGYADPAVFSRFFSTKMGIAPSQIKKQSDL